MFSTLLDIAKREIAHIATEFSILRICQNVFQNGCITLYSHHPCVGDLILHILANLATVHLIAIL